ncbi:Predicted dehydrogenase [Actinopolyspora xinjiangensis]|uniref:Predicted dehydrogenase n=1 Tax=Actinopolyspora xinjiangensis TaxID=405564 RepID=A0A1H0VLY2_9ACTN|nr:Gfo/Idh/MocA family oxidoreductase [Actinopolyspora xinjiangensis]SDP79373.1 Predicted dehydrogenase [Actinopolyspora xinjiangensis]
MRQQTIPGKPLGVGLVGLSAEGGWGVRGHLPALKAVDGFELRALAGSDLRAAEKAGDKYGVPHVFDDVGRMAAHDEVDVVVVAVRVPRHRELIVPALNAGKTVVSEWPLARDLAEAEELATAARGQGVRTVVGLQARSSPVVRYVHDLVEQGYVGTVLSTSVIASGGGWGSFVDSRAAYTADRANGATMLSIPFGHTVDALTMCLSGFAGLTATTSVRRPEVRNTETGETLPKTAEDQIAVTGELHSGAVASVHYRGGASYGTNMLWEINGTDGDLVVSGDIGHLQFGGVTIRGASGKNARLGELPVPEEYVLFPELEQPALNVAQAYSQLGTDIAEGTSVLPDFEHAVEHHRLLDRIQRAAATGTRQ